MTRIGHPPGAACGGATGKLGRLDPGGGDVQMDNGTAAMFCNRVTGAHGRAQVAGGRPNCRLEISGPAEESAPPPLRPCCCQLHIVLRGSRLPADAARPARPLHRTVSRKAGLQQGEGAAGCAAAAGLLLLGRLCRRLQCSPQLLRSVLEGLLHVSDPVGARGHVPTCSQCHVSNMCVVSPRIAACGRDAVPPCCLPGLPVAYPRPPDPPPPTPAQGAWQVQQHPRRCPTIRRLQRVLACLSMGLQSTAGSCRRRCRAPARACAAPRPG